MQQTELIKHTLFIYFYEIKTLNNIIRIRIQDNRWWKRSRGRPARRWRDELDNYWMCNIWQRIVQDRQMWKQHAEAFAQPRDITLRLHCDDDVLLFYSMMKLHDYEVGNT